MKLNSHDIERLEGPDPSTDTVCIHHDKPIQTCTRCKTDFFRCCITLYGARNDKGLCGDCAERDYADSLYHDFNREADEVSQEDLEAAAEKYDELLLNDPERET